MIFPEVQMEVLNEAWGGWEIVVECLESLDRLNKSQFLVVGGHHEQPWKALHLPYYKRVLHYFPFFDAFPAFPRMITNLIRHDHMILISFLWVVGGLKTVLILSSWVRRN